MEECRATISGSTIVIPKTLTKEWGLRDGDSIVLRYERDQTFLIRKSKKRKIAQAGMLDKHVPKEVKGVSIDEMHRAILEGATRSFKR